MTKTQLPHLDKTMPWKQYSGEDYKRHILFCGTEVIQTESTAQGPAKAIVLRTGELSMDMYIFRKKLCFFFHNNNLPKKCSLQSSVQQM